MIRLNSVEHSFRHATLPVQEALSVSRPSRPWDLFQRLRSRRQRQLSALRSSGTRLAQGLLKRLVAEDSQRSAIGGMRESLRQEHKVSASKSKDARPSKPGISGGIARESNSSSPAHQ
jgi:hypothetical protein